MDEVQEFRISKREFFNKEKFIIERLFYKATKYMKENNNFDLYLKYFKEDEDYFYWILTPEYAITKDLSDVDTEVKDVESIRKKCLYLNDLKNKEYQKLAYTIAKNDNLDFSWYDSFDPNKQDYDVSCLEFRFFSIDAFIAFCELDTKEERIRVVDMCKNTNKVIFANAICLCQDPE